MATGYCNAPIIVSTSGFTQRSGAYFPSVVLKVGTLEFTAECGSGKEIRFDLSRYAKGLLCNQSITPTGSVPTTTISYGIWQRELMSGEAVDTHRTSEDGSVTVYLGRGDALSRFRGTTYSGVSYKPSGVEVVNAGDYHVERGQTAACNTAVVSADNTDVYIESNPLRHQLIFLNSFGRWESASALTRESKQFKYSSTEVKLDGDFPDNIGRPNRLTNRQLDEVIWSMSSGYVTSEWGEWWANEVMAAEYVWLRDGTSFMPVVLVPDDNTSVYTKSKGSLCSIKFKVKFI